MGQIIARRLARRLGKRGTTASFSNVRSIVIACRFLLAPLKIRAEGVDRRRYDDNGDDDDHDGCNDNGDDDDGDDRANVLADGGDYGGDTVFQMTQLRPRTRMCHWPSERPSPAA